MLIDIATRLKNITLPIRRLSAQEAAKEIAQNDGLLIDVRESAEVQAMPVSGAASFPRGVLEMQMLNAVKDPKHPLYIHCASGVRATLAAEQLMLMGYENVSVVTCSVNTIKSVFDA